MARLEHFTEYLFTHPGTSLTLDADSPGFYVDASGAATPVFNQVLRSGQILLLFSDLVPKAQSQDFLAGKPIDFVFETQWGSLQAHLEMKGSEVRARVKTSGVTAVYAAVPEAAQTRSSLMTLIGQASQLRASALHVTPHQQIFARIDGRLVAQPQYGRPSPAEIRDAALALAPPALHEGLEKRTRFEFSHRSKDALLQVRGQQAREGVGLVVQVRPLEVPTVTSLNLPEEFDAPLQGAGLWVFSGAPGQGTSSTVAALLDKTLRMAPTRVATLERPIDFVMEPHLGLVQQLEVGIHCPSYAAALEDIRRDDTDLIVIAELDDAPTLVAALNLAQRGQLVWGVVKSPSVVGAVERLLQISPPGCGALSSSLRGVFGQSLVPNTRSGHSLCWELLVVSDPVRALLRQGTSSALTPLLSHTSDNTLMQLVIRGEVEAETALARMKDRSLLEERLAHSRAA